MHFGQIEVAAGDEDGLASRIPPFNSAALRYSHHMFAAKALAWPGRTRPTAPGIIVLAVVLCLAFPAMAVERSVRVYDERDGLTVSETCELAQDSRGFLWIGTIGGLTRFDGSEMRAWAPDRLRHVVQILATGPYGEVIVAGATEPLRRVTDNGVETIAGPRGGEIRDWVHATLADDGALWYATGDTLWRRDPRSAWGAWSRADFDSSALARVFPAGGDSVFVATQAAVWLLPGAGPPQRLVRIARAWQVQRLPDGRPVVASRKPGRIWRIDPDGPRLLHEGVSGVQGMAVRDSTIWANVDNDIVEIPPHAPPRRVAPLPGLPTGRPLLVDRESTLWIGGFRGLMALPEPETVCWNDEDGLPSPPHAHHLCRTADAIWVVTWSGTARIDLTTAPRRITAAGRHSGRIRPDGAGRLWAADMDRGFICYEGEHAVRFPRPGLHGLYGSALRADGRLWLATDDGLFLTDPAGGAPRAVVSPPPREWPHGWNESWVGPVLEDNGGRLWLGHDEEIWSCSAESLAAGLAVNWHLDRLPGSEALFDLVEIDSGVIWVATSNAGILERRVGGWVTLPGNASFGSLRAYGMVPSPRGGVWILMAGTLARVIRRPDLSDGWETVERLTSWQGLPTQQAGDIQEDPDGRLWLASLAGLVEIPPGARSFRPEPPPVALVDVQVDGRSLPLDGEVRLPWRRNRLEIRFATLSFRDRTRLRYQIRTRDGEAWQDIREPMFRFVDVAPGRYRAEVRASLDGDHWSTAPASLDFRVGQPWWREPWAMAAAAALLAALLRAIYRVRVDVLLRLERQRTRIAMDLHDEVGAGLGSIGILAGLASDARIADDDRRALAGRIAEISGELGGALADIVRSLRHGADTLESLGMRLAARARRLVPGQEPRLVLQLPGRWPDRRLAPELLRELQVMALESLHNAVRHARAGTIELGLAPAGDRWRLWIRDDGRGMPAAPGGPSTGQGLRNLRDRAESIGADLSIESSAGTGTMVEIRFPVDSDGNHRTMMRARSGREPATIEP